jgi:hypothetical protein
MCFQRIVREDMIASGLFGSVRDLVCGTQNGFAFLTVIWVAGDPNGNGCVQAEPSIGILRESSVKRNSSARR